MLLLGVLLSSSCWWGVVLVNVIVCIFICVCELVVLTHLLGRGGELIELGLGLVFEM